MKLLLAVSFAIVIVLTSCGPTIYKASDINNSIASHKSVAILPAITSIQLRPNQAKKLTSEQIQDQAKAIGFEIQDKMYSWFLKRSDKLDYTVSFQNIQQTNALLKEAGILYEDLASTNSDKLSKILNVDAVIYTTTRMDKPMSDGAAIATAVLVGFYGSTNKVETTISIQDGISSNVIWRYDHTATGSVGSSTGQLVNTLMKNASKKFPYKK